VSVAEQLVDYSPVIPDLVDASSCLLDTIRLTSQQSRFYHHPARKLVWRGPNTVGKSVALAKLAVDVLRGTHPVLNAYRPPVRLLVVSESWTQMDPLCEKLWSMIPRDEIDDRVDYAPGEGFSGFKEKHIPFVRGPGNPTGKRGRGSVLHFATYAQGAKRIAGGQFHGILGDEPMPETVFGELQPRTSRYHAWQRLTFTPTPESPPLEYLRELIEKARRYRAEHDGKPLAGGWEEMQTSVDLDALTPRGGLVEVPWKTQAELDELIESYLEVERGMRVNGDWEALTAGRRFDAFDQNRHVTTAGPSGQIWTAIGIDHGARPGRETAKLVAVSDSGSKVWLLDEIKPPVDAQGRPVPWSIRDVAREILAMIDRHPWIGGWSNVDHWVGDRATSGDFYGTVMSNDDLMDAFAGLLRMPRYRLQQQGLRINVPYKAKGTVLRGVRLLNSMFKTDQAFVSLHCQNLIAAMLTWEGQKDSPAKDHIDAARYAVEVLVDQHVLFPKLPSAGRIY
jgi:phage terminase large subunit-like protein